MGELFALLLPSSIPIRPHDRTYTTNARQEYLALTRVLQEATDDSVTRLNFSLVLLYDCHCNFLYERFHLSERLCAWRKQPDRLLASTGKRRSETSCLIVKAILGCVPDQSTLVSRLMPPKSRSSRLFRYRK